MTAELIKLSPDDYDTIINQLNVWWGGRSMTDMLPRLFFKHFSNTSFIIKNEEDILGFIVGFQSQTDPSKGYVHFVGVNPTYRKQDIGKTLYRSFFNDMKTRSVSVVECVTSSENHPSIAFHQRIGFKALPGQKMNANAVPYTENYDGAGEHRVIFQYKL